MTMYGTWADMRAFTTVTEALNHFSVPLPVWAAVTTVMGDPGEDLRLVAALPRLALVTSIAQAVLPDGNSLNAIQATQVGLVWRLSRRVQAAKGGIEETHFVDEDPWQEDQGEPPRATEVKSGSQGSGVKERVLKMASLVDQMDESELLPPSRLDVDTWMATYVRVMGALPFEAEEPTANQLAALEKKVKTNKQGPYVDFGVWTPYERRMSKQHTCRVFTPLGDGSFLQNDIPGPASFQSWTMCWRVFKAAAICLDIASLSALDAYYNHVERMVQQWPSCWGLVYRAEDGARAEKFEKMRRHFQLEASLGRQVPRDWDPDRPWSCILVEMTKQDAYWSEKVHVPAAAWVAAGGRGAPVVATEAAVLAHLPGVGASEIEVLDGKGEKRKAANRERRAAKKKKWAEEREELKALKAKGTGAAASHETGGKAGKGKGKGLKSSDQAGNPLCFSWAAGNGPCGKLPPGAECVGTVKTAHKCRKCLSPAHRDADCTAA